MTFYSQMNKSGNFGGSWRNQEQTAGYRPQNYQEFGAGNSSVKLHHNPGGKTNFSLAQTGQSVEADERFDRIKPGVSQPFGRSNYDVDETYHQRTATKNQSQIAFGNDNSNAYNKNAVGSFNSYSRPTEGEDPRFPKKKVNFNDEPSGGVQWQQQAPPSRQKSSGGGFGGEGMSMRDRYLQEKAQAQHQTSQSRFAGGGGGGGGGGGQSNYSNAATYAPSSYGGQSQWGGGASNYEMDSQYQPKKQNQFAQNYEDNSWQKPKKTSKQLFDNNQFTTKEAPFGMDQGASEPYNAYQKNNNQFGINNQQFMNSDKNREQRPAAGPGAFTSVKYSGNPPGGKSSITF